MSTKIDSLFYELELRGQGFSEGISTAQASAKRFTEFMKAHPVAAAGVFASALIGVGIQAVKMAEEVNKALGIIADRVPGAVGHIDDLRHAGDRLAVQYGLSQQEIIGVMDATSRAGQENVEALLQVTEAAVRAGRAIGKNGAELVNDLDTALDIFGVGARDATVAVSQLFAIAEGRTSLPELQSSLALLAGTVQGTGLRFIETASALAVLISRGFEPGRKVAAEFARVLEKEGVEGIRALAGAAAGPGSAEDAMDKFTAAVDRNSHSIEASAQRARSEWKAAYVELGNALIPIATTLTSVAAKTIRFLLDAGSTSPAAVFAALGAAAARAAPAIEDVAGGFDRMGQAGGIAAGAGGKIAATLIEAKNAASEFGKSSTADLTRYKTAIEAATAAGKADGETQKLLVKITEELSERRKKGAAAAKEADEKIAASSKALLELKESLGKQESTFAKAQANLRLALELKLNENLAKLRGKDFEEGKKLANEALAEFDGRLKQANKIIEEGVTARVKLTETTTKLATKQSDLNLAVDKGTAGYRRAEEAQRDFAQDAANAADIIAGGADAFLAMADAAGFASEEITSIVNGIVGIGDAVAQIAGGNVLGGIATGIKGLAGVIGGLFGESAAERQLKEALDKNRQSLEELSRNVGDLNINLTGNQIAGVTDALTEFFATGGANAKGWADRLGGLLLKKGLTLDDLEEVAKTLNVDLRPGGHLSPEAIKEVLTALGLIEPTQFANTFRGQRDKDREEADLFNLSSKEQAENLAETTATFTKGGVASAFAGFDFSTKAGRDAATATIQDFFKNFDKLPVSELGGLQPAEFLEVLQEIMDLIETLNDEAAARAEDNKRIQDQVGSEQKKIGEAELKAIDARAAIDAARKVLADPNATAEKKAQATDDLKEATRDLATIMEDIAASQATIAELLGKIAPADAIASPVTGTTGVGAAPPGSSEGTPLAEQLPGSAGGTEPTEAEPVFTPDLEAQSWEELLRLQTGALDHLGNLDEMLGHPVVPSAGGLLPPLLPPLLPAGFGAGGVTTSSLTNVTITFGDILLQADERTDANALLEQFLEVLRTPEARRAVGNVADEMIAAQVLKKNAFSGNVVRT